LLAGYHVHGLDNLNAYYDVSLKQARLDQLCAFPLFTFTKGDMADRDVLMQIFANVKPAIIINLAAQAGVRHSLDHPQDYIDANITGFLNILEGCRAHPVDHLIFASSSSVYGANQKIPFAETDRVDHPVSLYAVTKKSNELMAHCYAHLFGIPSTGLRFFTVYGPWGRPDMAVYKFTQAIIDQRPIDLYHHGQLERDFTYIDDVIKGIVGVIGHPPSHDHGMIPYQIFNLGNQEPVTVNALVAIIEKAIHQTAIKNLLAMPITEVPKTYADMTSFGAKTGFAPTTPLEKGIAAFVDWYRKYHNI
jgi:UDP-glucuronate 4-epimerase